MFGAIKGSLKKKISEGLIGKWLKGQKLEPGESNCVLMMFEEQGRTMLLVCAIKIDDSGLRVSRVIESIDVEEAL